MSLSRAPADRDGAFWCPAVRGSKEPITSKQWPHQLFARLRAHGRIVRQQLPPGDDGDAAQARTREVRMSGREGRGTAGIRGLGAAGETSRVKVHVEACRSPRGRQQMFVLQPLFFLFPPLKCSGGLFLFSTYAAQFLPNGALPLP